LTFDYPPVSIGPASASAMPTNVGPASPWTMPALFAVLAAAAVAAAGGAALARRSVRRSRTAVVQHVASADRR